MAVAVAVGRYGIDTMLVASQVVLSIVLPFIIFPLMWLTSSKSIMRVRKPLPLSPSPELSQRVQELSCDTDAAKMVCTDVEAATKPSEDDEYEDFSNGKITAGIGYLIWFIVIIANAYVLISLMIGNGD